MLEHQGWAPGDVANGVRSSTRNEEKEKVKRFHALPYSTVSYDAIIE